jgi:hypothetical protein
MVRSDSQWLCNRTPLVILRCLLILTRQSKNRAIVARFADNLQAERKTVRINRTERLWLGGRSSWQTSPAAPSPAIIAQTLGEPAGWECCSCLRSRHARGVIGEERRTKKRLKAHGKAFASVDSARISAIIRF